MFHDSTTLAALMAQGMFAEMGITIEGNFFTLMQKEEACEFICNIPDKNRRIELLKQAVNSETEVGAFFWCQRGLTSTSITSGTLAVLSNVLATELKIQPLETLLEALKLAYGSGDTTAVAIIQNLSDKYVSPMLLEVHKRTSMLDEYIKILTQLLEDAPEQDTTVSQSLLNLISHITNTARQYGGVRVNEDLHLGDFVISYAPEYFKEYLNLIMILLNKRPNDFEFFLKVMDLFVPQGKQSFISRTLVFWGNIAAIKIGDKRINSIDDAMHRYMKFVVELFKKMPKSYLPDSMIRDVFNRLLANDFYQLFRCLEAPPFRLVVTLLRLNFFTYTSSRSALKRIMDDGHYYGGHHPKIILVGCLLRVVEELQKEEDGEERQIRLLENAINPSTDLGYVSWYARDTTSCGLRRGTLKGLIQRLATIQGLSEEQVTVNMEDNYGKDKGFNVRVKGMIDGLRQAVGSVLFKGVPERGKEEVPVEMVELEQPNSPNM